MINLSAFPSLPKYKAIWYPIQMEPILASGEKITVAITAIASNGEFKSIIAIRPELLDCLYGDKATNMESMIQDVIYSLNLYSQARGSLSDWCPPFQGFFLGHPQEAFAHDINGVLKQAIQFSASLSSLSMLANRENNEIIDDSKAISGRWITSIQNQVIQENSSMVEYFNKSIQLGRTPIKTRFGFLSENYVSNFGLLIPQRLSASATQIKSKILDIDTIKNSQGALLEIKKHDVIVGIPSPEDVTVTDKVATSTLNYLNMLKEVSDQLDINLISVYTYQEAASRVLEMAA